jgi:endogenous inhibitor of DNA gyrase (YacG/DUF329 family)
MKPDNQTPSAQTKPGATAPANATSAASSTASARIVPCPQCGGPSRYESANRWRPFCSERCRMIDLGAWASDSYVVPGKPVESDDDV